jgi:hypothetical protein
MSSSFRVESKWGSEGATVAPGGWCCCCHCHSCCCCCCCMNGSECSADAEDEL